MGFNIELSFKITVGASYTKKSNYIIELCEKNNAIYHYFINELEGGRKIERSHRIANVNFDNIDDLTNFIKIIKKDKGYYIDCISSDEIKSNMLYASSYYLTHKMTKEGRKIYLEKGKSITI